MSVWSRAGEFLHLDPCIPRGWPRFEIAFQHCSARYELTVENPRSVSCGVSSVEVNGTSLASGGEPLRLTDDDATHSGDQGSTLEAVRS